MNPKILVHAIETWNPPTCYLQPDACLEIQGQMPDRRSQRIVRHLYRHSAIDKRHTAVEGFGRKDEGALFGADADGKWSKPGTGERNRRFVEVSKTASVDLARKTLGACPHFGPSDITHVITVSCTGFHNPGPDFHIVRGLGLSPSVQRYNLGFMGCYAAFPALRLAKQFCQVDPNAVVLVLCLELCSLHLQLDPGNAEALMAGSIFGDGAACALVSARRGDPAKPTLALGDFSTRLTDTGEESMAWEIGDHGFEIVLSSYVPDILGDHIRQAVLPMLRRAGLDETDIGFWAVHPGGRAILDRIETALALAPDALAIPRRILRDYGNMSSATILFVLREWMRAPGAAELCAAMAFGPGLTVEMALLERIPALASLELAHA